MITIPVPAAIAPREDLRGAALTLAREIAENAPLAVQATRATLRDELAAKVKAMPFGTLIADTHGNLFGTTNLGGPIYDSPTYEGTVFELTDTGFAP
jgi:hypothetical protein